MKFKSILAIIIIASFFACGPKVGKTKAPSTQDVMKAMEYSSKINSDNNLKEEYKEGVLTDLQGVNDIGKFEYTTFFDERKKELVHIQNLEITEKKVLESYYFKNNKLLFIQIMDPYEETSEVGDILKIAFIFANQSHQSDRRKLLIDKGKRFQKEFETNH